MPESEKPESHRETQRLIRYQSTETRHNLPHRLSCRIKDAVQKVVNAMSKIFKGGIKSRKDFLNSQMQSAYHIVGQGIKTR